jgi:hypothetical protein
MTVPASTPVAAEPFGEDLIPGIRNITVAMASDGTFESLFIFHNEFGQLPPYLW